MYRLSAVLMSLGSSFHHLEARTANSHDFVDCLARSEQRWMAQLAALILQCIIDQEKIMAMLTLFPANTVIRQKNVWSLASRLGALQRFNRILRDQRWYHSVKLGYFPVYPGLN